jgi:peroxiredoxin
MRTLSFAARIVLLGVAAAPAAAAAVLAPAASAGAVAAAAPPGAAASAAPQAPMTGGPGEATSPPTKPPAPALPTPPTGVVPRKAGDLTLADTAGAKRPLSSYKGQVVVVELMLTKCPHCWRIGQTLDKLQKELGPRGFQAIAVAFDKDVNGPLIADYVSKSGITYPATTAAAAQVDSFLGRTGDVRAQVPQLVVIDRTGQIRAQSHATGEKDLETEGYLRTLLDGLLKESSAPAAKPGG